MTEQTAKYAKDINQGISLADVENIPFLNETSLGLHLKTIFPDHDFIHNKKIPESNILNRPDYYCKKLQLVIEFDGYGHFTNPKTILADIKKDSIYSMMGIKVIRIPYFIQLDTETVEYFFNVNNWISSDTIIHPHGFINPKATTPAYICSFGIIRFNEWRKIVSKIYCIKNKINLKHCKLENISSGYLLNRSWWFQVNILKRSPEEIVIFEEVDDLKKDIWYGGYPT